MGCVGSGHMGSAAQEMGRVGSGVEAGGLRYMGSGSRVSTHLAQDVHRLLAQGQAGALGTGSGLWGLTWSGGWRWGTACGLGAQVHGARPGESGVAGSRARRAQGQHEAWGQGVWARGLRVRVGLGVWESGCVGAGLWAQGLACVSSNMGRA